MIGNETWVEQYECKKKNHNREPGNQINPNW